MLPSPTGPAFPILQSKLVPPRLRPGIVPRTALVNRLRAGRTARVASILGPAGYGKTTLLVQWSKRDSRPFAWVSLDEHDNDPSDMERPVKSLTDGGPLEGGRGRGLAGRTGGSRVWPL